MNRFIFLSIFFITIITGCSNDDNSSEAPVNDGGISGTWSLINVSGGFIGADHDFQKGLITWVFNPGSNQVTVDNGNTDTNLEDSFSSGTYTYSINEVNNNKELTINNNNLGTLTITADKLTIDEQFRDGFKFTFER